MLDRGVTIFFVFFINDPPPLLPALDDDGDDGDDGDGAVDPGFKADNDLDAPFNLDVEAVALDLERRVLAVIVDDELLVFEVGGDTMRFCSKSSSSFNKGFDSSFFF